MRRLVFVLAAGLALCASACAVHQQTPTGENYYSLGQQAFAQHDYKGSAIYFQKLIDQYPFSPYAEDAELKIGLSQYQDKRYAEAISSLGDFEKMHPTSKQIELASYYLAMAHYDQIGRPDQDQSNTEQALQQFEIIERRYPETGFAALAHQQISVCREMLARHQLLIGDFYYKKANFRAAESRLAELMQKWPDTPVGDEALYQLGTTLEKEGKKYSAAQAFTAVVLHYPGTTYASKAQRELKKLHQPVDTEEDPLHLVLTESGFGDTDQVRVRQGDETAVASAGDYPPLPILKAPPATSDAGAPQGSTVPDPAPDAPPVPARSSISSSFIIAGRSRLWHSCFRHGHCGCGGSQQRRGSRARIEDAGADRACHAQQGQTLLVRSAAVGNLRFDGAGRVREPASGRLQFVDSDDPSEGDQAGEGSPDSSGVRPLDLPRLRYPVRRRRDHGDREYVASVALRGGAAQRSAAPAGHVYARAATAGKRERACRRHHEFQLTGSP